MIRGALLIALAALLWATTGIVAKFLFTASDLQAISLGFLRLVVALPFFFALMLREQIAEARSARSEGRSPMCAPRSNSSGIVKMCCMC